MSKAICSVQIRGLFLCALVDVTLVWSPLGSSGRWALHGERRAALLGQQRPRCRCARSTDTFNSGLMDIVIDSACKRLYCGLSSVGVCGFFQQEVTQFLEDVACKDQPKEKGEVSF